MEKIPSSKLRTGDLVFVAAGEFIPSDGEIVEGVASVDESAITGESAPVIREAGGDRSAVTGGLIDRSDTFDNLAIRWNEFTCRYDTMSRAQLGASDLLHLAVPG